MDAGHAGVAVDVAWLHPGPVIPQRSRPESGGEAGGAEEKVALRVKVQKLDVSLQLWRNVVGENCGVGGLERRRKDQ